jgi:hypothetical protein
MIVNADLPKYRYFKEGLMNYCLLRQMVKKQYEHCLRYPNDIKTIRNLYGDYPQSGYGSPEVERFISLNEYFLNSLIYYPTTKREITNLFNGFYAYGYEAADSLYFERLKERFDAINSEIIRSLNMYYDFEKDKIYFSNFSIHTYFRVVMEKALYNSRFNKDAFMKSKLYKAHINGDYGLSVALDTYDIKMNQDFWDKYTVEDTELILSEVNNLQSISSLAGVEKYGTNKGIHK